MTVMSVPVASRPGFVAPFQSSKTPRDRLLRLDVEGDRDAPFLTELLDLVHAHALVPLGMAIHVGNRRTTVRLEFDGVRSDTADALVTRLHYCAAIRTVTLAPPE